MSTPTPLVAPTSDADLAPAGDRVSVVVPCRNESARIATLLDAIRSQDVGVLEVVIVDTGSTDGTMDIIGESLGQNADPPIRVLSHSDAGIAEAVNWGVEAANGEIIVRLDGHSRPRPDYVGRALAALNDTGAAVVGGVWEIAPGGSTVTAEAIASAVAHPVGAGDAAYRTVSQNEVDRVEVDTVPFGCFRKTTWEALGGFDEELLTNEDYDFNYRARSGGSTVVLDPAIRCTYFARATFAALASQYFRYGWWKAQMLRRHPRSLRWRQALPASLIPLFVILCAASLVWPPGALLLGALVLTYAATLTGAAVQVAGRERRWSLVGPLIAAFGIVHVAWSTGFATNIASFGRWMPGRRAGPRAAGQSGFSGVRLLLALAAILVLAVIAPPGLATLVNQSRIDRADEETRRIAESLQRPGGEDRARGSEADLLGGPGNSPEASDESEWVNGRVASLGDHVSQGLEPDPWGNRYLVNIGALRTDENGVSPAPNALWVLSAGPNGIIETPYASPAVSAQVAGDDIGTRIE